MKRHPFTDGFIHKCAEYGVNPIDLIKLAALFDTTDGEDVDENKESPEGGRFFPTAALAPDSVRYIQDMYNAESQNYSDGGEPLDTESGLSNPEINDSERTGESTNEGINKDPDVESGDSADGDNNFIGEEQDVQEPEQGRGRFPTAGLSQDYINYLNSINAGEGQASPNDKDTYEDDFRTWLNDDNNFIGEKQDVQEQNTTIPEEGSDDSVTEDMSNDWIDNDSMMPQPGEDGDSLVGGENGVQADSNAGKQPLETAESETNGKPAEPQQPEAPQPEPPQPQNKWDVDNSAIMDEFFGKSVDGKRTGAEANKFFGKGGLGENWDRMTDTDKDQAMSKYWQSLSQDRKDSIKNSPAYQERLMRSKDLANQREAARQQQQSAYAAETQTPPDIINAGISSAEWAAARGDAAKKKALIDRAKTYYQSQITSAYNSSFGQPPQSAAEPQPQAEQPTQPQEAPPPQPPQTSGIATAANTALNRLNGTNAQPAATYTPPAPGTYEIGDPTTGRIRVMNRSGLADTHAAATRSYVNPNDNGTPAPSRQVIRPVSQQGRITRAPEQTVTFNQPGVYGSVPNPVGRPVVNDIQRKTITAQTTNRNVFPRV